MRSSSAEELRPDSVPHGRDQRLDVARGLSLFLMILHHLIYDLRYIMGLDVFRWQEDWWFDAILRPVFLVTFLWVSGYATRFSRDPVRRATRMTVAAALLSLVTYVLDALWGIGWIPWNMIHTLALGLWLNVLCHTKASQLWLLLGTAFLTQVWYQAPISPSWLRFFRGPQVMDHLAPLPWLIYFQLGTLSSQLTRNHAIPVPSERLTPRFLAFLGRHGLGVYALHQPLILGVLYLLRAWRLI